MLITIQQINDFMSRTKYKINNKIDYRNIAYDDQTLKSTVYVSNATKLDTSYESFHLSKTCFLYELLGNKIVK